MGIGRAASVLNQMLTQKVVLQPPKVSLISVQELTEKIKDYSDQYSAVNMDFKGVYSGSCSLIFSPTSAANLVSVLVGEEEANNELDAVKSSTLSEVGNIVINSVLGSLAKSTNKKFEYTLPYYSEGTSQHLEAYLNKANLKSVLLISTQFVVDNLEVVGEMSLVFSSESLNHLMLDIDALLKDLGA